ncbi:hypothetical protein LINPERPRIM_LOCUS2224 [Linum perenne]
MALPAATTTTTTKKEKSCRSRKSRDAFAGGRALPVYSGKIKDRPPPEPPPIPPILLFHQHDVPLGSIPHRPYSLLSKLLELRSFRKLLLLCFVGQNLVGEIGA